MKCIQLNNPKSNKMPNVFISTATLILCPLWLASRLTKYMQTVYINEPTQLHIRIHIFIYVYVYLSYSYIFEEREILFFAYS